MQVRPDDIVILRQDTGRFDRRFRIGPAVWSHHDLLWVHEGRIELLVDGLAAPVTLAAPDGILLFAGTPFAGDTLTAHAEASICHFRSDACVAGRLPLRPRPAEALALQAMIVLSLRLAREGADLARRQRLVAAVLDGFEAPPGIPAAEDRIDRAWRLAEERLDRIRSLTDVAAQAGLSESAFRAAHRSRHGTSAGSHLIALRLDTAERLLATTDWTVDRIAKSVGYGHAETLSHALTRERGHSPRTIRRFHHPFA
ncbi:helix-turn-helix domain-containing protein [Alsobacter sp. R-9]